MSASHPDGCRRWGTVGKSSSVGLSSSKDGPGNAVPARRSLRPIAWWWVIVGLAAVGIAIWGSTWWLLHQTHGLHGSDLANARMDAIKTGLSVGAGTGGAV